MNQNDISAYVRKALHDIRAYLSPIKTFIELERRGLAMVERENLLSQAGKSLDLITAEIDRLSVDLKNLSRECL